MKTFYGGIFIEKQKLEEEGIHHPIKLEYYKSIREDESMKGENNRFGISVVKTEYLPNNTKVERKEISNLTNDENQINEVLRLFKENEVTPIAVEDILCDLYRRRRKILIKKFKIQTKNLHKSKSIREFLCNK